MSPLISVIIPAYNAEQFLAETLSSVFSQTYSNIEVIIVNDGSSDNTEALLQNLQQAEPRLKIISQNNQGISAARNAGINHATGEFIAFIDSDDRWDLTFLEKLLKRQNQMNANLVYTGNINSSSQGDQPRISDFREQENLAGYLTQKSLLHVGCLLIKKSFLDEHQLRFDEQLKTGEDIVFICTLFCLTEAYSVPEYLYYYSHRESSVMRRPWSKQDYLNDLSAWIKLESIIKQHYQKSDRQYVVELIEAKVVYYKLRLLWLLLLAGRQKEVKQLLNDNFLTYSSENLAHLPKKYAGIRRKLIESKNSLIWKLVKLTHRRKINLVDN